MSFYHRNPFKKRQIKRKSKGTEAKEEAVNDTTHKVIKQRQWEQQQQQQQHE